MAYFRFGRRPVLILTLFFLSVAGCLSAFAPSVQFYALLRFFQGASYTVWPVSVKILSGQHSRLVGFGLRTLPASTEVLCVVRLWNNLGTHWKWTTMNSGDWLLPRGAGRLLHDLLETTRLHLLSCRASSCSLCFLVSFEIIIVMNC